MSSPRTSRCLVLSLRPVFQGVGEPGIFQVPEFRRKFGIFLSMKAYMEVGSSEFFHVPAPMWRRQLKE